MCCLNRHIPYQTRRIRLRAQRMSQQLCMGFDRSSTLIFMQWRRMEKCLHNLEVSLANSYRLILSWIRFCLIVYLSYYLSTSRGTILGVVLLFYYILTYSAGSAVWVRWIDLINLDYKNNNENEQSIPNRNPYRLNLSIVLEPLQNEFQYASHRTRYSRDGILGCS